MKQFLVLYIINMLFLSCSMLYSQSLQLDKDEMLRQVNAARVKGCRCGTKDMPPVQALVWSDTLAKAAQLHSNDMYSKKYFNHVSPNGKSTLLTRLKRVGYQYSFTAENIAQGQKDVKEVVEAWLNSPGHCQNIMNANYKEMGAAVKGNYWTQVFGTRLIVNVKK